MRTLILGAGHVDAAGDPPAWLAEQDGRILVERLVCSCEKLNAQMIFAIRTQDVRSYSIDSVIRMASSSAHLVSINAETQGAACTAMLCIEQIVDDEELLILNGNEFLNIDYLAAVENFRSRGLDAGVVSFQSIHPRYSYVSLDENAMIVEASEKRPISKHATAGFYWFRHGEDFVSACMDMIRKDVQIDGKFFISLVFNELVLKGKNLGIYEVDSRSYTPLKSRRQISAYEVDNGSLE